MRTQIPASLALLTLALVFCQLHAQTQGSAAREEVIRQIESYAEAHASTGTPIKDDLAIQLFHDNKAGLTPQDISRIYIEKYKEILEAKKPWWDRIPRWLYLAGLLLALIGKTFLSWIEERAKKLFERFYERYAGANILRRKALQRYRNSIVENYQSFSLPFRDAPLNMRDVYVPLKVMETGIAGAIAAHFSTIEAAGAMRQYRKLVVKGNPGSGKSMLLRSILLMYADGRLNTIINDDPVPVLVELSRLNEQGMTIQQQLVGALGRCGFPKAESFVSWALEHKRLMVLLDGLDEVSAKDSRSRVVQLIRDFVQEHGCRVIITCRTQVYHTEFFAGTVNNILEIAEFEGGDILRFLKAWEPGMQQGRSVEQLMQILSKRPQIRALAGNPLLLTMIAYLYADARIELPYSRADFYAESTSLLLKKWHGDYNRFGAAAKNDALSRLALLFQVRLVADRDSRSIAIEEVLKTIKEILPRVELKVEQAHDILDEIVDRSGLMLRIDDGTKVQFTHLTMQEYFAAVALRDDSSSLLEYFGKDPDAWREVIKLWCGIASDASQMISKIATLDEITALECVADARVVDSKIAEDVGGRLRGDLGNSTSAINQEGLAKAFGLLAARRPRGKETLHWLTNRLHAENANVRNAVARALAYSYSDEAAVALTGSESPEAETALEIMGDVAVHGLLSTKKADALLRIGTSKAVECAVSLLWDQNTSVCSNTAWSLAARLQDSRLEAVLHQTSVGHHEEIVSDYQWIWQPFHQDMTTSLPRICARIAELLANDPRPTKIDPRLGLPLFIETRQVKFLQTLPEELQKRLQKQTRNLRAPRREDWLRIFRPTDYRFSRSALFLVLKLLYVLVLFAGTIAVIARSMRGLVWWVAFALSLYTAVQILVALVILIPDREHTPKESRSDRVLAGLFLLGTAYFRKQPALAFVCGLFGLWVPLAIYYCSSALLRFWPLMSVIVVWAALYCFGCICYLVGYRWEHRAKNPLHGLLAPYI